MESKDAQVKHVVIGLAAAVLELGAVAVTSDKMSLEFAFQRAWHDWPNARHFPSLRGHKVGNFFWIGVGKSRRRQGATAAWRQERWTEPYLSYSDGPAIETLELIADERASVDDWMLLGRLFLSALKPAEVRRE